MMTPSVRPSVKWLKDGQGVRESSRLQMMRSNNTLSITRAQGQDSGRYVLTHKTSCEGQFTTYISSYRDSDSVLGQFTTYIRSYRDSDSVLGQFTTYISS